MEEPVKTCCQPDGVVHIIRYTLPRDREELDIHMNAGNYLYALLSFERWLKQVIKYEDRTEIATDEVRQMFYQVLSECNVDL
jgi:hypothetical protein